MCSRLGLFRSRTSQPKARTHAHTHPSQHNRTPPEAAPLLQDDVLTPWHCWQHCAIHGGRTPNVSPAHDRHDMVRVVDSRLCVSGASTDLHPCWPHSRSGAGTLSARSQGLSGRFLLVARSQASFGKFLTSHLPFSHWERVFMTNSMAAPYLVVFIISTSKDDLIEMSIREFRLHWVMFSCVCGVGISFASWILRDAVSATTNSLINVIANIGQLVRNSALCPP